MTTEAQKRATNKYNKTHTTQIILRLNNKNDADILAHLSGLENKQGYIKELIRKDVKGLP